MHLAGLPIDLHVGHPGRPGRAKARERAVDVAGVGEALAGQPVTLRWLNLRHGMRQPAGLGGGGAHQFRRARIGQVAQTEFDRIDASRAGQFVDVALVGEAVGQGRDAAQPTRAQDRRHVVDGDALVGVGVGRHRRAVAHFEGLRHRRHRAGQQQSQGRRAVAGVAGLEVIRGQGAGRVQPAAHLHQLRRALGLPGVFLGPAELHPHRRTHGAGQQQRVGGHVVGAVAAVAAGGFHADHVDGTGGQAGQQRQIGPQGVRVLGAGPDRGAGTLRVLRPLRQGAGRADRGVQLVGPQVGAVQALGQAGQCGVHIALVGHHARRGRVRADGLAQIAQRRNRGRRGERRPIDLQGVHRGVGLLLTLGHDADEIADHDQLDDAGQVGDGGLVHAQQAAADEVACIEAGVGRAHHAAVQHARQAHVVDEDQSAAELVGQIDAWGGLADHTVVGFCFGGRGRVQHQLDMATHDQVGVG